MEGIPSNDLAGNSENSSDTKGLALTPRGQIYAANARAERSKADAHDPDAWRCDLEFQPDAQARADRAGQAGKGAGKGKQQAKEKPKAGGWELNEDGKPFLNEHNALYAIEIENISLIPLDFGVTWRGDLG